MPSQRSFSKSLEEKRVQAEIYEGSPTQIYEGNPKLTDINNKNNSGKCTQRNLRKYYIMVIAIIQQNRTGLLQNYAVIFKSNMFIP